jgi:hypothetical protein
MRALAAALLFAAAAVLSGCSSVVDHIPTAVGGLPEAVPPRPAEPPAFPAVNDMPPGRDVSRLTEEERKRLRDDLIAIRERAVQQGTAQDPPATASTIPAGTARNP